MTTSSLKGKLFVVVVVASLVWVVSVLVLTSRLSVKPVSRTWLPNSHFITVFPHRQVSNATVKTILLWTDFFGAPDWEFHSRHLTGCRETRCRVTWDKDQLNQSDAVLFNSRSLHARSVMPGSRRQDQVWVLHNSEPPYYIFLDWERYAGVFNWTSWFRLDADVYSPYGNFTRRKPTVAVGTKPSLPNFFSEKTNMTYWAASSCTDRGRRYRLVEELKRYLEVDTYGSCGTLTCRKGSPRCNPLFRQYKFSLALENGQCRDYVTEKFWGALARKQVPVVWGGADYELLAPPHSFIDMRDFPSMEALAAYLTRVAGDEQLYNSYFRWREDYVLTEPLVVNWCSLCTALHDSDRPAQSYTDLRGWAAVDTCRLYSMWRQLTDYIARFFFLVGL